MSNGQAFHLRTPEIRANCVAYISQIDDPDTVVTIKRAHESRSDAQHRLRWVWFTQMQKALAGVGKGRDKEQWNLYFKHKYMPTILITQDEDYQEIFDTYKQTCQALTGKHKERYQKQFWDRVISTKDMSVASMSEWLNTIESYVLDNYQLVLATPDDLRWAR